MPKNLAICFVIFSLLSLTGCESLPVYKIDIQQGNIIKQEQVDKLRTGMTKRQVLFLMGTPVLEHNISPEQWDYVYTFQPGGKERTQKKLVLHFDKDKLTSISGPTNPRTQDGKPLPVPLEHQ